MPDFKEIPLKEPKKITADRILMYWSYVPELWSKMIVRITGYQLSDDSDGWSHMGIAFVMSDGTVEAYEALFSKGFTGPEPLDSIRKKIEKKKGEMVVVETGIQLIYVNEIYERCRSWVGTRGYNKLQLLSMWFFERIGRWVGLGVPKSPYILVCSEVVARLLYPLIDLCDKIRTRFDEVNPNSTWRKWLKIKQIENSAKTIQTSKTTPG